MISNWFDLYSMQTRLAPALLSLFPFIILIAIQFPQLYEIASGLLGLALSCGILTIASHFVRTRGKKVEQSLYAKWGAPPTTRFLLNKNSELDYKTHKRYLTFFSHNIPDWKLDNPKQDIDSAILWLLEKTRDTDVFNLIFKENISYGFRRNCLGIKPVGLIISSFCFGNWLVQAYFQFVNFSKVEPINLFCLTVSLIIFIWWLLFVNEEWVKEAANNYAKALLRSIDYLGEN